MISLPSLPLIGKNEPVNTFRFMMKETGTLSQLIHDRDKLLALEWVEKLIDWPNTHEQVLGVVIPSYVSAEIVSTTFINSRGNSRFNDDTREVWYCAFEHDTAVEEVAYHRKRIQDETNDYGIEVMYREIFADFIGSFHDAQKLPRGIGILGTNPKTAYPLGQKLAHKLRTEGSHGIIYPSVRRPGGICLVAFHREIVQNVRLGYLWKMSWNKEGKFSIDRMEEEQAYQKGQVK